MADFLAPNRGFVYVNGGTIGTKAPSDDQVEMRNFPECEVKFKFPDSIIKKANEYSVSLQRWETPLQLVPIIHEFPNAITVTHGITGQILTLPDGSDAVLNLPSCYTIFQAQQHIMDFCNDFDPLDAAGNPAVQAFRIHLTPDLRWKIDAINGFWASYDVVLSAAFARWCNFSKTEYRVADLPIVPPGAQAYDRMKTKMHFSYASVADTYNRIRRINFSTDLFVQMEVSSGYAMTRLMSDYIIPKQAAISYNLFSNDFPSSTANFTEYLPQTITYNSPAMHGRWSPLTTDQPIYNFRVRATAMCMNFATLELEEVRIPVPLGQEFAVKLLFAMRSEVPVTEG